jgi:ribulose-phosphate 3-epimerase
MIKISPSILASDFTNLSSEIRKIETAGADMAHIDVMDGHFVPNISIGLPVVDAIRQITDMFLDVHLMIDNPDTFIERFAKAGADNITVHAESSIHLHRTLSTIKDLGKMCSVSLNPSTPLNVLECILPMVDMVLLMSVNPGFGGQKFIPHVLQKIEELKKIRMGKKFNFQIQVDGGIDIKNIYEVTKAGADNIVAGTSVFKSEDVSEAIADLRSNAYGS